MVDIGYALRADITDDILNVLPGWLAANAKSFFVVKESHAGENPHIHVYFTSCKKISAVRKDFQRKFPANRGNAGYSLKVCDDDVDAYGRYMCKGVDKETLPDVMCRQGLLYTDAWVKSMHEEYWVNNERLMKNKRKRVQMGNIVEKLELECKEAGLRFDDRKGIAHQYIKLYVNSARPINIFHARNVVNTVSCLLDDGGSAAERLACEIADRV